VAAAGAGLEGQGMNDPFVDVPDDGAQLGRKVARDEEGTLLLDSNPLQGLGVCWLPAITGREPASATRSKRPPENTPRAVLAGVVRDGGTGYSGR